MIDPCVGSFYFCIAKKRCPIAAKCAGLIGILPCCVLNDFLTFARFVRPLLATILFIWAIWSTCIMYHVISVGKKKKKKKRLPKQKTHHRSDFEADRLPETRDFFWPY